MKYLDNYKIFESRQNIEKVNFEWNGLKFKNIGLTNYNGSRYYAPMGAVSQVIRQYIKQKYPNIPFQISTESYSGGDSARVYLSPLEVTHEEYKKINAELSGLFQEGHFNGMEDIYEYKDDKGFVVDIKGSSVDFGTKYLFVEHRPKWGSAAYKKLEEHEKKNKLKYQFIVDTLVDRESGNVLQKFEEYGMDRKEASFYANQQEKFQRGRGWDNIDSLSKYIVPESKNDKPVKPKSTPKPTQKKIEPDKSSKVSNDDINIMRYGRGYVVYGAKTRELKEDLKAIGARFNFRLTHPETGNRFSGWVISPRVLDKVEKLTGVTADQ